ncbi:trans-2-enoyl-CoA reductase family protein [Gammaproteobacteria bacterium]|nr:trans-2-enoyl-CoA reductase family protein [Gammaproteobacteria bacterium]
MIIKPKIIGSLCISSHPLGCIISVKDQIQYVKSQKKIIGAKKVLVIGASSGYGLASRIVSAFGVGSSTLGVFMEYNGTENRTASAGWYNSSAFENFAHKDNLYAKSINGDAFSLKTKKIAANLIRKDLGKIDLLIYSLASPRRLHPVSEKLFTSVLKSKEKHLIEKTINPFIPKFSMTSIKSATEEDIYNTVMVMGGEDWEMWIDFLKQENLLENNVRTVAYSYMGSKVTYPIYKNGTIGSAKEHLKLTADKINKKLITLNGYAAISMNKIVVTQASAAIPIVPLYTSLLFKIMKNKKIHENCIQQMYRLFNDYLSLDQLGNKDESRCIRLDNLELCDDVQKEIESNWITINNSNYQNYCDIQGYCDEFNKLYGFGHSDIDYSLDVNPIVKIPSVD